MGTWRRGWGGDTEMLGGGQGGKDGDTIREEQHRQGNGVEYWGTVWDWGAGMGGCSQLVGERLCVIWGCLRKGGAHGGSPGAPRPHTATNGPSQVLRAPGGCGDPVGDLL